MLRLLVPLALAAIVAGCASDAQLAERDALAAEGRAIAEAQCSSCHAVGTYGQSAAAGAPPFRHVLEGYSGESLTTDLVEGIRVAHAMPTFQFDPKGADALVAYLRTIQTKAPIDDQNRRK